MAEKMKQQRKTMRIIVSKLMTSIENNLKEENIAVDILEEQLEKLIAKASNLKELNQSILDLLKIDDIVGTSETQIMAPLPADRILESPPFSVVGVDFAGPLFAKGSSDKYYILLCTCAVTRSIHLELVPDLSTETFLLALRRFFGRRGLSAIIYSDNAKTFKRANHELKAIWNNIDHDEVQKFFGNKGIDWRFIVERGAWWGGFWERMVRSVKTSLKKVLGKTSLSVDELVTVLIEIEAILNSRPLTYVYNDSQEPSPLTPAHFLVGKRILTLPPSKLITNITARSQSIKEYNYKQRLLNNFWQRWHTEYLLTLRSANVTPPSKENIGFKLNDIVLIREERIPRNMWRLGKVIEVYPGRDGKIRACLVKTSTGTLRRPVQLLHNFELND